MIFNKSTQLTKQKCIHIMSQSHAWLSTQTKNVRTNVKCAYVFQAEDDTWCLSNINTKVTRILKWPTLSFGYCNFIVDYCLLSFIFFQFLGAMVIRRYLFMYPIANGEADEVDGDKSLTLITDTGFLANISSTFWFVSTTFYSLEITNPWSYSCKKITSNGSAESHLLVIVQWNVKTYMRWGELHPLHLIYLFV